VDLRVAHAAAAEDVQLAARAADLLVQRLAAHGLD